MGRHKIQFVRRFLGEGRIGSFYSVLSNGGGWCCCRHRCCNGDQIVRRTPFFPCDLPRFCLFDLKIRFCFSTFFHVVVSVFTNTFVRNASTFTSAKLEYKIQNGFSPSRFIRLNQITFRCVYGIYRYNLFRFSTISAKLCGFCFCKSLKKMKNIFLRHCCVCMQRAGERERKAKHSKFEHNWIDICAKNGKHGNRNHFHLLSAYKSHSIHPEKL